MLWFQWILQHEGQQWFQELFCGERWVDKVEIILERLFYDSPLQCKLYEKKLFLFFLTLSLVPVTMPDSGGTWQCLHLVNFKHNYIQGPMLNGWVLGFNQNKMEIHMVYQVMSSIWRKFKQGKRTGSAGSKRGKLELSVGIPGEASLRQLCLHKNMKQLRSRNKICGKSIPGRGRSNWKKYWCDAVSGMFEKHKKKWLL